MENDSNITASVKKMRVYQLDRPGSLDGLVLAERDIPSPAADDYQWRVSDAGPARSCAALGWRGRSSRGRRRRDTLQSRRPGHQFLLPELVRRDIRCDARTICRRL